MTFKFPPDYDPNSISQDVDHGIPETRGEGTSIPRTNRRLWNDALWHLWLRHFVDKVSPNELWLEAWSVDKQISVEMNTLPGPIFCASFLSRSVEVANKVLEEQKTKLPMSFLLSTATGGLQVEFAHMRRFNEGWLGSVTRTRPDPPEWFQLWRERVDGNMPRGDVVHEYYDKQLRDKNVLETKSETDSLNKRDEPQNTSTVDSANPHGFTLHGLPSRPHQE